MDPDTSSSATPWAEEPGGQAGAPSVPARQESVDDFRAAIDAALDAIIMVDHEGKISLWNKAAENIFGYAASEALGQEVHALIAPPRYRETAAQAFRHFEATGQGAVLGKVRELTGIRKAGAEFPLELSLTPIYREGKWLAVGIVRDITVRKQAESSLQRSETIFRSIIELSPIAHALSDVQNNITLLNVAFAKAFGYTREDIPNLAEWSCKAYPDSAYRLWVLNTLRERMAVATQQGTEFEPLEVNIRCKDGKVRVAMLSLVWLGEAFGKTHLATYYDITERKLAEQQIAAQFENIERINAQLRETNAKLGQAQSQLLQSEKMASIGLLAAGVAHEINNPIGYVHSNLGTLEKYVYDIFSMIARYEEAERQMDCHQDAIEEIHQFKAQIDLDYLRQDIKSLLAESREGLMRVKKIVLDLKDFSHSGGDEDWQWVDLTQGLESTLNVVWNELKYKCEVRKEYGSLPAVQCLPSQLNQVFMNLLVNAAQAIETKGIVTLRTGQQGDQVWVEVADTGKGIPAENLQRLFDPFFTTKPVGQGTGLGLSVSYSIVEKHHGRIEVASRIDKGSIFRVWLPVRQAGEEPGAAAP